MLLSESPAEGVQRQEAMSPLTTGSRVRLLPWAMVNTWPGGMKGGVLMTTGMLLDLARPQTSSLMMRQKMTSPVTRLSLCQEALSSPGMGVPLSSQCNVGCAEPLVTCVMKVMESPLQTTGGAAVIVTEAVPCGSMARVMLLEVSFAVPARQPSWVVMMQYTWSPSAKRLLEYWRLP